LKRLLAQTQITFSNSIIESWWRTLKHQWLVLNLNSLDTIATLEKLVGFYVNEHNTRLPPGIGASVEGRPDAKVAIIRAQNCRLL
jgi:hypothetical protein